MTILVTHLKPCAAAVSVVNRLELLVINKENIVFTDGICAKGNDNSMHDITFIFLEYLLTYSPITDHSSPPPDF